MRHDVIVIGLGGVGSAAAWQLAIRGLRVLGIERHSPAHDRGSSHGRSRITRRAYMEGAWYVPLVLRSEELWRQLESEQARQLLRRSGGVMVGTPDSQVITGSLHSAAVHGLQYERLDAGALRERFPLLRATDDLVGVYEPDAGVLCPEDCVRACLQAAADAGAELSFECAVQDWDAGPHGVRVRTAAETFEAAALVVTPGPWASRLLPDLGIPLRVTREVMFWMPASEEVTERAAGAPIFMWERDDGPLLYGFPALDGRRGGIKVALHHAGRVVDADTVDRAVNDDDVAAITEAIRQRMPDLGSPPLHSAVCLYTSTPDRDFLVGCHPGHERVALAAGLSGHGFKFASGIGEALAQIVIDGKPRLDLSPAAPARFRS